MTDENKTRLDPNNPKPQRKAWAKDAPSDPEQIVCQTCSGSLWIKADQCPLYHKFEVVPGSETLVCVFCLARGEVNTFLGNDYE